MKKTLPLLCLSSLLIGVFAACNKEESKQDAPPPATSYTISWIDEKGTPLSQTSVEEGATPSYSYSVTDTAEWDYTFIGWSTAPNGEILNGIPAADKDASYYANVTAEKQKYTVVFHSNGGSAVSPQTVEYGEKAVQPETPNYDGHKFMGWSQSPTRIDLADFQQPVTGNVEYYAVWNKIIDVKSLLSSLLNGYELNPLRYIPESMQTNYSANLIEENQIIQDYSASVSVSDVRYGFGEQWQMVIENLEQSKTFFNALSVVDTLSASSITEFNNYFDNNPSDTAHHQFADGIYNVAIDFDGEILSYVLDYTADLPLLGTQTVQIALSMNANSGEKIGRIQLGDANALTYKILDNSYEFAIKYLGVRKAYFCVENDDNGLVSGKIYEYLTVSSVEIASAAEFYITDQYVSVIGNKADGLLGFTGYINELYDVDNGKLLGYEVQETLSAITYNTLWFNLNDVTGIQTLKYQEQSGDTAAAVYINGSTSKWQTKKVGGIGAKMLSRRFDIEFRTQYVYSYDAATESYVAHKISVPMLFVQEECYDTFIGDVKSTNNVTVSVSVNNQDLEKLLDDYDALIPVFISNKDKITPEVILAYIGNKITF